MTLTQAQIDQALAALPGWQCDSDTLTRAYVFDSFAQAIAFMVRVGFEAQALNHHPMLCNVYNRVTVTLCTHDAGDKITDRDLALAQAIQTI